MKINPLPICCYILAGGSDPDVNNRCVGGRVPAGANYWTRRLAYDGELALKAGVRTLLVRAVFGCRTDDEPNHQLSYRGAIFAKKQAPWLLADFFTAFMGLKGRVDQVIFHVGSPYWSYGSMSSGGIAGFFQAAAECIAPILALHNAGLPVAISNDESSIPGCQDMAWWHWIEALNCMGLPQYVEGAGQPTEPRQLRLPFLISDKSFAVSQPNPALHTGEGILTMDDSSLPAGKTWQNFDWVRGWIETRVRAGLSVALPADLIVGAGIKQVARS